MAKTTTRIYAVSTPSGHHLVEAATQAQALHHVIRGTCSVSVPTSKEVARMLGDGVVLEVAGEARASDTPPPHT